MMISSFVTNPKWDWPFVFKVMNYSPVLEGLAKGTTIVTVASMIIGVTLGILLAIMRLSDNPVLRGVSFVYTWFFRAGPRYVLMVILGLGFVVLYAGQTLAASTHAKASAAWLVVRSAKNGSSTSM